MSENSNKVTGERKTRIRPPCIGPPTTQIMGDEAMVVTLFGYPFLVSAFRIEI